MLRTGPRTDETDDFMKSCVHITRVFVAEKEVKESYGDLIKTKDLKTGLQQILNYQLKKDSEWAKNGIFRETVWLKVRRRSVLVKCGFSLLLVIFLCASLIVFGISKRTIFFLSENSKKNYQKFHNFFPNFVYIFTFFD